MKTKQFNFKTRLVNLFKHGRVAVALAGAFFACVLVEKSNAQTNLLANPSFELGVGNAVTNWSLLPGAEAGTSVSPWTWQTPTRTGTRTLSLHNLGYAYVSSDAVAVGAGLQYDLSSWVRGDLIGSTGQWFVRAYFFDAAGVAVTSNPWDNSTSGGPATLSSAWALKTGRITTPAGTTSMKVMLGVEQILGAVVFDDVRLSAVVNGVTSVTNLLPNASFETVNGAAIGNWPSVSAGPGTLVSPWTWQSPTHTGTRTLALHNRGYGYFNSDLITVSANTQYDVFSWVKGQLEGSIGDWFVRAYFYDAAGVAIASKPWSNSAAGGSTTLTTTWADKGSRITTPAGTTKMRVMLGTQNILGWVLFDDVRVLPVGGSTNLIANPGFETGTGNTFANWLTGGKGPGSSQQAWTWQSAPHGGARSLALHSLGRGVANSDQIMVAPNTQYDIYTFVKGTLFNAAPAHGVNWYFRANYYNSTGGFLSYTDLSRGLPNALPAAWTEKGLRITTPSAAAKVQVQLGFTDALGMVVFDDVRFNAVPVSTFSISGNVGIAGVSISTGSASTTSDNRGNFTLTGLAAGNYTLTPTRSGCPFAPLNRAVTVGPNATGQNFSSTACGDPSNAAFWGTPSTTITTRAGMLTQMKARLCANGYYPDYFCGTRSAASSENSIDSKSFKADSKALPLDLSDLSSGHLNLSNLSPDELTEAIVEFETLFEIAKNHNLNGCSVFDDFPLVGTFFIAGNGWLGGADNLWYKRACNNHDQCYQHGFDPQWRNHPQAWGNLAAPGNLGYKFDCDQALRTDSHATCTAGLSAANPLLPLCHTFAEVFYYAVENMGLPSYHVDKDHNASGGTVECSPTAGIVTTTGTIGVDQTVHVPHNVPDTNCDGYPIGAPPPPEHGCYYWGTFNDVFRWRQFPYGGGLYCGRHSRYFECVIVDGWQQWGPESDGVCNTPGIYP